MKYKDSYLTICSGVITIIEWLQPFEGSHDADVAHGEHEFDTAAL